MHRYSNIEKIKEAFFRLKKAYPPLLLETEIIVGFPTETFEEFLDSLRAIEEVRGGWIGAGAGLGRIGTFLSPSAGIGAAESTTPHLELILSFAAVAVAFLGWFLADRLYRQKPAQPVQLAEALPGAYKFLANKYYVDEIYGATVVKPLLGFSKYVLGWVVDTGLLGGLAWLLGGIALFTGAILQRWQSGNLRSYAAWLAAGAAAVLLFVLVPWTTVWPDSMQLILKVKGR